MRIWLTLLLACLALASTRPMPATAATATEPKVLRYAFRAAESGFDPSQLSDIYSRAVTSHIFEALYSYDPLARPARLMPLVAAEMPETDAAYRRFIIRIRPGIHFTDDPAFKGPQPGKGRELVAQDFVYSLKRFADPALKSPNWSSLEEAGILGLAALRRRAIERKERFDYDTPIEGLRALDRYTLQIRTEAARPRLVELVLAGNDLRGALAREVVEHYGDKIMAHPVGTGPFLLKSWRRSSQIVLERNPAYRERHYAAQPGEHDAEGRALLARLAGRRIPMVDRVEIAIIEETQPRWLSFLNGQHDFLEYVPEEFVPQAMPGGRLAPNLSKKGVQGYQLQRPDVFVTIFNMEDPVVGGYTPDRVALRRAIGLALDIPREIDLVRRGQAVPAQSMIVPHTSGFDPGFKSEMGDHDPARAKALLDLYGYIDRDGDGWRELPNGEPLLIRRNTQSDSQYRQLDALWQKNLAAVGIRLELKIMQWPEALKTTRAGQFMVWVVGSSAERPDGQTTLQRLYGPGVGGQNLARFRLPEFDALYLRMQALPDGPEREALFHQAKRLSIAYMPYKSHLHRIVTDLAGPQLIGYRRPLFWLDWWQFVDIELNPGQQSP